MNVSTLVKNHSTVVLVGKDLHGSVVLLNMNGPTLVKSHSAVEFNCGKKGFTTKQNLLSHERIHSSEKPFTCGFAQKEDLARHEYIHTGEKRFTCGTCGNGSTLKHNLLNHERLHTGEKQFSCRIYG
jgi:KRAB domain-containing zinc finger protein